MRPREPVVREEAEKIEILGRRRLAGAQRRHRRLASNAAASGRKKARWCFALIHGGDGERRERMIGCVVGRR
jgi:hypothetical protein